MRLRRLEVEGGFLDGMDLTFEDGLNVLIGARGSGKTSVIEVLRYCLGIRAVTDEAERRAREHALWVLGDGFATVTFELDGVERVIRRGIHQDPEGAVPSDGVLFVSQKEIEEIGLDAVSRRRMLDAFAHRLSAGVSDELDDRVETVARQLFQRRSELDDVIEQLGALAEVPDELKRVEGEQAATQTESAELVTLQSAAGKLSDEIGELAETAEGYEAAIGQISMWADAVRVARDGASDFRRLPRDHAADLEPRVVTVRRALDTAREELGRITESLEVRHAETAGRVNAKRRELSELNSRIEDLAEGAGRISRAISALREQDTRRKFLIERRKELEDMVQHLAEVRGTALDELATLMDRRHERRQEAAERLNGMFGGDLRVEVIKAGEVSGYEAALGQALQGSGLQWRDLARQIAERMSPRELVAAVEALDADAVADAASISINRAKRVVAHLASADTTEIVLANVDEDVEFSLLDGQEFKGTDRLSLGQRCTVVLPLLLAQDPDLAVLDQPEDHLDNAFIVDTVVDVLRARREDAQRLIATHNANIPVIGDADRVVVLDSSGRKAFIAEQGELGKPAVVEAITRLMEGGADAFKRRAEFYGA